MKPISQKMRRQIEEYKVKKEYFSAGAELLRSNTFGNICITHDEVYKIWKEYDNARKEMLKSFSKWQKIKFFFGILP